jgi:integrase
VRDLLDRIVDEGKPYAANRLHALLRVAFGWFVDRDIVPVSPVVTKAPAKEESRDRVLGDDEIRWLWSAADAVGWPFGPMAKLLLVTAQRREEVSSAEWSEFNLEGISPEWTIPRQRTKNGVANSIGLPPLAVEILRGLPQVKDEEGRARFVLSTTGSTPISGFAKAKAQLDAAMAALAQREARENGKDPAHVVIPAWRFHDLRRTAASGMAAHGIAPHLIERVLNHRSGTIKGVAAVYNRFQYQEECRQALAVWAAKIASVVGLSEGK